MVVYKNPASLSIESIKKHQLLADSTKKTKALSASAGPVLTDFVLDTEDPARPIQP